MGIASLVLGIISLIMSLIPGVGIIFCITAVIGIILGIVSLCKKLDKGKSIAGIITSSIAIIVTILYMVGMVVILGAENGLIEQIKREQGDTLSLEATEPEVKQCKVGETFRDDKIAIKFIAVNENFKGYSEYAEVKTGYKIIRAEFEFENLGTSSQYISSYDFDCYADGYNCDSFWSVEDSSFSTTLSSGKKAKGVVYFEVPKDSESISLEYNVDTWNDEIVEFIVK